MVWRAVGLAIPSESGLPALDRRAARPDLAYVLALWASQANDLGTPAVDSLLSIVRSSNMRVIVERMMAHRVDIREVLVHPRNGVTLDMLWYVAEHCRGLMELGAVVRCALQLRRAGRAEDESVDRAVAAGETLLRRCACGRGPLDRVRRDPDALAQELDTVARAAAKRGNKFVEAWFDIVYDETVQA
jgi:hypothetical protein